MKSSFMEFQTMLERVVLVFSFSACLLVPFEDICAKVTSRCFFNALTEVLRKRLYFTLLWPWRWLPEGFKKKINVKAGAETVVSMSLLCTVHIYGAV